MHLVVDMQGAQTGSRFRGIGRLTNALVKAILRNRGTNRVTLAFSALLTHNLDALLEEYRELVAAGDLRIWHGVGPTHEFEPENLDRRDASERLREAFLASLRPDAVLITSLFEGFGDNAVHSVGLLTAQVPTAAIFYDLIPLKNPGAQFLANPLQQSWYRRKLETLTRCDRLLAISESSRREAITDLGYAVDRIDTISCGCDPAFRVLTLSADQRAAVSAAHGIGRPFIMYAGGGDVSKNLERLIQAFGTLEPGLRNRHELVFAGRLEQHDIDRLRAAAQSCGMLPDDLRLIGYVTEEDLIRLYNCCTLFVMPSLHEGFGLPPLEAMACGAPVITSNATSLPEVVGLDEAMFDPLSVPDIAAGLQRALTDLEFRERLVAHGRARAAQFTWDRSAARAWNSLQSLGGHYSRGGVSPALSVERTGIFGRRGLKILVTKLDHLGDFILSIPSLTKLHARYPDAVIDIVVGSWNVAFARQLGLFRRVHPFDFFKRRSANRPSARDDELIALLEALDDYDIAIDLRRQPESRFLLARVRARLKVGYQTFNQDIDAALDIMLRAYKEGAHIRTPLNLMPISRQMLRLVDALPDDPNDFIALPAIADGAAREPGRVAIFPKAGTDVREWGPEKFTSLVAQLLDAPGVTELHVFFVNDGEAAEYRFTASGRLQVHIGLEFPTLVAALSGCGLCVANNSGGIHLASYLGVRVIGIYSGHELAAEWGPQFNDSLVIHRNAECAPCHLGRKSDCAYGNFCLADIGVEDVYRKCIEVLAGTPTGYGSVALQSNEDALVKELIGNLALHVDPDNRQSWIDIAMAIAANHPTYMMLDEPNVAHAQIVNSLLDHRSKFIEWSGFSSAEPAYRWSDGKSVAISFYIEGRDQVASRGRLLLVVDTYRRQRIIARFNGKQAYDAVRSGRRIRIAIPVGNIRCGLNRLELTLPDAASPGEHDPRLLAIAVRRLRIVTDDPARPWIVRSSASVRDLFIQWH
jgi:glycosyltransferase involved in cell wall biosynthesis/ADP-heptose:LPS heptosyltransferase